MTEDPLSTAHESPEELGKRLAAASERLQELQYIRQGALPGEIAALDSMIVAVEGEISSINAKILSRVSVS